MFPFYHSNHRIRGVYQEANDKVDCHCISFILPTSRISTFVSTGDYDDNCPSSKQGKDLILASKHKDANAENICRP